MYLTTKARVLLIMWIHLLFDHRGTEVGTRASVSDGRGPVVCEMQTAYAPLSENSCKRVRVLSAVVSEYWHIEALSQKGSKCLPFKKSSPCPRPSLVRTDVNPTAEKFLLTFGCELLESGAPCSRSCCPWTGPEAADPRATHKHLPPKPLCSVRPLLCISQATSSNGSTKFKCI